MPKPTLDEIREKVKYVQDYYQSAHAEFDRDFLYLSCAFSVDVAQDVPIIRPPTAQIALGTLKDHVPTNYPHVFIPKASNQATAQEHKEKLRRFLLGLLNRIVMESPTSFLDTNVETLGMCNMAIQKIVYKPFIDEEDGDEETRETKRRNRLPVVIMAVHPRIFYPDPSDFPQYAIEIYERDSAEIAYKYPKWERPPSKQKTVLWVEYYDDNYRCYLANGEPVLKTKVEKHGYGFLPYSWTFAGFGLDTADNSRAYKTQGMIRPHRSMIEQQSYLWSVLHEIDKKGAWQPLFLELPPGVAMPSLDIKAGTVQSLPPGSKLITDAIPQVIPAGVLNELQIVQDYLDEMAPRPVRGIAVAGVRSGYDRSLMVMEARLRYGSVSLALGRVTANTLSKSLRLLENKIKDTGITVWGREPQKGEFEETIKGSDVKGHYICYVDFAPAEVEDEYRRANTGALLKERGIISNTRTQERYAGIVDPEEEQTQIWADRYMEQLFPTTLQLVQAELAKELAARRIKEGINLPPPGEVLTGQRQPPQRELAGSPTSAPFVATQPKPFSSEEEQQVLKSELQGLGK